MERGSLGSKVQELLYQHTRDPYVVLRLVTQHLNFAMWAGVICWNIQLGSYQAGPYISKNKRLYAEICRLKFPWMHCFPQNGFPVQKPTNICTFTSRTLDTLSTKCSKGIPWILWRGPLVAFSHKEVSMVPSFAKGLYLDPQILDPGTWLSTSFSGVTAKRRLPSLRCPSTA